MGGPVRLNHEHSPQASGAVRRQVLDRENHKTRNPTACSKVAPSGLSSMGDLPEKRFRRPRKGALRAEW